MNLHSIDAEALVVLHRQGLIEIGRPVASYDGALLNAALGHPLTHMMSGTADVATVAAAYAAGMLKHQPFASDNLRAAFLAMGLFLYMNDWRLVASQEEATAMMRRLSAGDADEEALAEWIRPRL